MLVLDCPSDLCLLRPEFGLVGMVEEPPGDTARFVRLRVGMRPKIEEVTLSSLDPEVRSAGEDTLESEAFLRMPLTFRVDVAGT